MTTNCNYSTDHSFMAIRIAHTRGFPSFSCEGRQRMLILSESTNGCGKLMPLLSTLRSSSSSPAGTQSRSRSCTAHLSFINSLISHAPTTGTSGRLLPFLLTQSSSPSRIHPKGSSAIDVTWQMIVVVAMQIIEHDGEHIKVVPRTAMGTVTHRDR